MHIHQFCIAAIYQSRKNMKKVTVILTSYNHEKFINETIDSILNQSFSDFELIIWDDASTDDSWDIIKSYQDSRIKSFRNKTSKRGIYGINKTISEIAEGEYIAIHHSDDIWEPTKLEKQVAFLDNNKKYGAVFTNAMPINEDSQPFSDQNHFYSSIFDQQNRSRQEWLNFFFYEGNALCHPSVLIRKVSYDACGLYRYGLAQLGDFDMWIRLCLKYEIMIMPEKLTKFRILNNEANSSGSRPETRKRTPIEYFYILQNYLLINSYEDLCQIFPKLKKFNNIKDHNIHFLIAMMALESKANYTNLFGLSLLYGIVNDSLKYEKVKEMYNFDKNELVSLSAKYDIFNVESIQEKNQQIQEKNQQIQEKEDYIHHLEELVQSLRLKNRLKNIVPKKAREVLHISKHSLKHPVKLLKVMDKQYASKLFKHIKQGNFNYILERMGHYINQEPSNIHLDLMSGYSTEEVLTFPVTAAPKVSIIIPVYNQFGYTHGCLRSILQFTNNIDYEIIIADDVSSDTTQNIHEYIKNIKVVRNKKNLGFLLNCNNAAKEAKGEYIFFLNNDTNVQKDWLSTLLETIENDSTIGMVGSKLVYPDGRQQEAGGIIWDDASGWNYGRLDNPEKPEYNYVKEVDYISGAAIMIRTELWKEIGGFDERYVPAYYEDTDLAFEVRKHGYKVILQPKSVVVHFEGISNGTDTSSGLKQYQIVNKDKFYDKWKELLKKEHFKNGQNIFTARDKSVNKKTLLFIDHYVPHFDQDAGSRATLHYLELFKKHDMNVKFLGDNFYHYPETPYVTTLEDMGIEVLYGGYYARNWEDWLAENAKNIDYIVLSRPHIATKYIDIVKKYTDAKIIYFAVDLHYLREEREYKIKKDKQILKSSKYWREIEFDLMDKSDLTCFYSYVEVDEIKKENPLLNTIQIPLYIYNEFKEIDYAHKNRQDIMFVGGFTHNPNVDAVVYFVEEVMPKIREKHIPFKVYIVGSNATEQIEVYANQHDDIIVTGRISDEELERLYSSCRLVIAPLRYGAGVKGKVVEALYNGIPLITTSVGAEGLINVESSLKIADNAMEFANAVIEVYSKEELGIDLSKKSIQYCKENFSEKSADKQIFNNGINLLK